MTAEGWRRAREAVEARARAARSEDEVRLRTALGPSTATSGDLAGGLLRAARVTLNFHPDRVTSTGETVVSGLRRTGVYLSQFVTGFSNGSRSAIPGGVRYEWESRLFGQAYDDDVVAAEARPVYGALDVCRDPHGGSPRFGSSYLVLADAVVDRTTFCVGDSNVGPRDVGTAQELTSVLAGLFEHAAAGDALGRGLDTRALLELLDRPANASPRPARVLDGYIEAQVHGGVSLDHDVVAIVVDPSFRGTPVETDVTAAARSGGFDLAWHRGSALDPSDCPADFRLPETPALARRIANENGLVDAAAIGRAALAIELGPQLVDGDAPDSDLQQLKYLWHAVLRFGRDVDAATGGFH